MDNISLIGTWMRLREDLSEDLYKYYKVYGVRRGTEYLLLEYSRYSVCSRFGEGFRISTGMGGEAFVLKQDLDFYNRNLEKILE